MMTRLLDVSAVRIPAKAQNVDDIFQFLFNLIDLFDSIVNFIENLLGLIDPQTD